MFYSLQLQMAGVILLSTMTVGGISLWFKRRRDSKLDVHNDSQQDI